MEFGCRYIYVDESKGQNNAQPESPQYPGTSPTSQNGVVHGQGFYDNFHGGEKPRTGADVNDVVINPALYGNIHEAEMPRSDPEVNGLQQCTLSPESNIYLGLPPPLPKPVGGRKTPPPVPQRRDKRPVSAPPVPIDISRKSNVYVGLPPTSSLLDGRKTPPPVPYRNKLYTDPGMPTPSIRNTMHCVPNGGQTEQPTIIIGSSAQNSRPPVIDRSTKPPFNKSSVVTLPETLEYDYVAVEEPRPDDLRISKIIQGDQFYVDSRKVNPTEPIEPIVPHCMIKPPIHQMSEQPQGVTAAPNDHCYLTILPALPTELEMQGKPLKPPDRPMAPLPEQPQGVTAAPNDHCYLTILPALPTELEMQGKPLKPPDRPMAPLPDLRFSKMIQGDQFSVDSRNVNPTNVEPIVPYCMIKPPIHQMSEQPQGVTAAPNDHCYLTVLPALPSKLEMQGKPLKPPDRPMTPLPVSPADRLPANCNILLLNIGKIVQDSETLIQEPPLLCNGCSSACSKLNQINDAKTWTCVFCAAENPLPDGNTFVSREVGDELYVGDLQSENEYSFADQTMIIFCIDISGSMSVTPEVTQDQSNDYNVVYKTRMESVKSALDQTLDFLHEQHFQKRVGLVTFSDQVKLYGDGTREPLVLQGAELLDPDYLKSQGEDQAMPHPLAETLHALKEKIQCLEETGATALGPAALVSIAMASKNPGSKVIICTDGRANTDLGNLEDISDEYAYQSSKLYYSNLGDLALQHSVVVSVVTIEGTNCRLPELGQLADKTGGKVNIVHPLKLANEFQSIIEEEIIATNVKLKVFLPQTMYFLYEETASVLEKTFGSTTADTVLSTEFNTHSSKIKEVLRYSQLPIQLHLSYTLPDGRSRRRILSEKRPVTNDCTSALETIDLSVLQTHSVQFSARLAMEGHVNEARNVALELKELIDLVMRHEKYEAPGVVYEDWEDSMAPIYEDLQVYMKEKSSGETGQDSHIEVPVVKTFSDEMAQMIFHMKRAKNRVLDRLKNQTIKNRAMNSDMEQ